MVMELDAAKTETQSNRKNSTRTLFLL